MAIEPTHRVATISLNLRSEPRLRLGNRLAILPSGQKVQKVREHDGIWWQVRLALQGAEGTGFVAARFLEELQSAEASGGVAEPEVFEIPPVHLREGVSEARRSRSDRRAFPLGEPGAPGRSANDPETRAAQLSAILDWLDVDHSARYAPTSRATYCNIYAYDVCYLGGAYLPRVWWTGGALIRWQRGESVPVRYGSTVEELNANRLSAWLGDFGATFGWRRALSLGKLQEAANQGRIGLIVARHHDANRSGHVAVVEREAQDLRAVRNASGVTRPITSQAGRSNHRRKVPSRAWWSLSPHAEWSAWIHD